MHYANGREAAKGDLVRGRGYNVKHEIIGKVVNLRPGPSCNLSVAYVGFKSRVHFLADSQLTQQSPDAPFANVKVEADIEFGQTDQFLAIDPETGEVLPPVDPPPAATVIPIAGSPGLVVPAPQPAGTAAAQTSAPSSDATSSQAPNA